MYLTRLNPVNILRDKTHSVSAIFFFKFSTLKNVSEYCWQMTIDLEKCVKCFLAALYYSYNLV